MADAGSGAGNSGLGRDLSVLRDELRAAMRGQFDRDLPFDELLGDRWQRATELGFGEGTSIYASSYVYGDVRVGSHSWIGPFTILDGSGARLEIGSYCDISAGVQIYTHDTVRRALTAGKAPIDRAPVTIGDSCHIGALAVISKGVTVGHHSIIGAMSFVNRDVEPYTIAVGTPCRQIGTVRVAADGSVRLLYDRERRSAEADP